MNANPALTQNMSNINNTQSNSMNGGALTAMSSLKTLFIFFFISMNAWILYYINTMRGICKHCNTEWSLPVISVILSVMILHIIISIFQKMPGFTNIVFFVLWAAFIILTLRFVYSIKDTKCKCTKEKSTVLLEQFMYINAFLIIVAVVLASILVK